MEFAKVQSIYQRNTFFDVSIPLEKEIPRMLRKGFCEVAYLSRYVHNLTLFTGLYADAVIDLF